MSSRHYGCHSTRYDEGTERSIKDPIRGCNFYAFGESANGAAVGRTDSSNPAIGVIPGFSDGGATVDTAVGDKVSILVGVKDGDSVRVGNIVGLLVEPNDGIDVGFLVGVMVGTFVGANDG
jgi:hypothetical protein